VKIRRDGSGVWLELESKGYAAQACAVTFQVLGHTLEIVSAHLRLGAEIEVKNVFDSYLKELGNSA
jgi:hypothetical protein